MADPFILFLSWFAEMQLREKLVPCLCFSEQNEKAPTNYLVIEVIIN